MIEKIIRFLIHLLLLLNIFENKVIILNKNIKDIKIYIQFNILNILDVFYFEFEYVKNTIEIKQIIKQKITYG